MTAAERTGIINRTSILGIVVNVLIAGVKIAAGLLASSIAIVSEGVNNAADALTSVLTMVGTRLAGRHPDAKHPFGPGDRREGGGLRRLGDPFADGPV